MASESKGDFYPKIEPIFSLAKGRQSPRFALRFSFIWRAVGALVHVRFIFSRAIVGRKT